MRKNCLKICPYHFAILVNTEHHNDDTKWPTYDYAMIRLSMAFHLSMPYINPICLPYKNYVDVFHMDHLDPRSLNRYFDQ